MGQSRSVSQLVGKLERTGNEIKAAERKALAKAGAAGANVFVATATPLTPGGLLAGKPWGAAFRPTGGTPPAVIVSYVGPVHLVHNPTGSHWIIPKAAGGSRASRAQDGPAHEGLDGPMAILTPWGPKRYALSFGTKGRPWFDRTTAAMRRTVPPIINREMVTGPIKAVF